MATHYRVADGNYGRIFVDFTHSPVSGLSVSIANRERFSDGDVEAIEGEHGDSWYRAGETSDFKAFVAGILTQVD